jgi:hypothetical protein
VPLKREEKLETELCEQYGETAFERGREFSGLVLCLCGLGTDDLAEEERASLYAAASRHLAALMETVLSPQDSAAMTACAKRIGGFISLAKDGSIHAQQPRAYRPGR